MHGLPPAPSSRGNLSTSGSAGSLPIIHPDSKQCVQRPARLVPRSELAALARPAPRLSPCRAQSRRLHRPACSPPNPAAAPAPAGTAAATTSVLIAGPRRKRPPGPDLPQARNQRAQPGGAQRAAKRLPGVAGRCWCSSRRSNGTAASPRLCCLPWWLAGRLVSGMVCLAAIRGRDFAQQQGPGSAG
jgi:hypothetical protein